MAEIGGQLGQFSLHIKSGAIPMDQGACGKSVAHIMEPRTTAMAFRPGAQAELLRQLGEGVARHAIGNPGATFGDEKSGGCHRQDAVSSSGILFELCYGRWMDGHMARLAKLRPTDGENAMQEVHISPVQVHGLVHTHATDSEKAEKSGEGVGAESLWGVQLCCLEQDLLDLFGAVDVGPFSLVSVRKKARGWDFRARIDGLVPRSEASHHAQPPGPGGRLSVSRPSRPSKRQSRGDVGGAFGPEKSYEIP